MPGERAMKTEHCVLIQEWHKRGHSSLEVTMSGLVINPEYSWLGASPDSVVHDPGCTHPNG